MASSIRDLERNNVDLQTMVGLVTEAARLQQELSVAWEKIKSRGVNSASLTQVGNEIFAMKKEVTKLMTFLSKNRNTVFAKLLDVSARG